MISENKFAYISTDIKYVMTLFGFLYLVFLDLMCKHLPAS